MGKSDQWVIITLSLLIVLHLSVWAIGYYIGRQACWLSFVNLLTGSGLIIYWGIRQLKIAQHYIELREMVVLGFEILVIAGAVYCIASGCKTSWIRINQYLIFSIHLLILVLGLIFMLTFKMDRLI